MQIIKPGVSQQSRTWLRNVAQRVAGVAVQRRYDSARIILSDNTSRGIGSGLHDYYAPYSRLPIFMGVKSQMNRNEVVVRGVVDVNCMTEAVIGTVWLINIPRGAGLGYFDGSRAIF